MSEQTTMELTIPQRLQKILSSRKFKSTCPGSKIAPRYKRVWNDERKKAIKTKVGEYDLDEFIQASANSTDLALLKKRCVELGEVPDSGMTPYYGDFSTFPENIHQMQRIIESAETRFNELPDNIKTCFSGKDEFLEHIVKGDVYKFLSGKLNAAPAAAAPTSTETGGDK